MVSQSSSMEPQAFPNNRPRPKDGGPHRSEEQLAVLSAAAAIIGVPVETLTSLRPNPPPDPTPYSSWSVPQTQDSPVDFWQGDARFISLRDFQLSSSNDIPPPDLYSPCTNAETPETSLEHRTQNSWVLLEALSGHQQPLENANHMLREPSGSGQRIALTQTPTRSELAILLQDIPQSLNPYANDQFSLSVPPATRVSHRIQPVHPQEHTDFLNIQQMQDFSDLFGDGFESIDAGSAKLFPGISDEDAIESPIINTGNVLVHDIAGPTVKPKTRLPSAPFVVLDNQAITPQRQLLTGEHITPSLPDVDAAGRLLDEESIGISSAERPPAATSTGVSTSLSIAASSNLYTLGPCTREWIVPKIRRKTAGNAQNATRGRTAAPKDPDKAPRRRGKFKTEDEKQKTALTRELSACIRCRIQRIRCDPGPSGEEPCLTCARIVGPTMCKLPCLRYKLTAASLFRDQKSPSPFLSQRWQKMEMRDITEWASTETKVITMNSPNLGPGLFTLEVREFVPVEGDRIEEVHGDDGRNKIIKLPPYAMVSLKKSSDQMRQHLKANVGRFISASIDEQRSPLIWYTYRMALNQVQKSSRYNEKKLLGNSLELWAAGRFWSNPLNIVGNETLGVDLDKNPSSPYCRVPEIPVMVAQSQIIMSAGVMGPLQHEVLHQLQTMILANEKRNWLTIYLTTFLLLHSCSMITRRNEEYAREINLPTRFTNPESITNLHMGAMIILAHFHYCNKGKLPFSLADSYETLQQLQKIAELDDEQIMFVRQTSHYVHSVQNEAKKARENLDFGHELYFASQMFDEEWTPSSII